MENIGNSPHLKILGKAGVGKTLKAIKISEKTLENGGEIALFYNETDRDYIPLTDQAFVSASSLGESERAFQKVFRRLKNRLELLELNGVEDFRGLPENQSLRPLAIIVDPAYSFLETYRIPGGRDSGSIAAANLQAVKAVIEAGERVNIGLVFVAQRFFNLKKFKEIFEGTETIFLGEPSQLERAFLGLE